MIIIARLSPRVVQSHDTILQPHSEADQHYLHPAHEWIKPMHLHTLAGNYKLPNSLFNAHKSLAKWAASFTLSSESCSVTYYDWTARLFRATSPQVSFSDQTPYFIGWSLQSMPYPVEMMKWLWSTMKVTFGRWTAFIFITAQFLYYFPLIKHETHPLPGFSVTSVLASVPEEKYSRFCSLLNKVCLMSALCFDFSLALWHGGPC